MERKEFDKIIADYIAREEESIKEHEEVRAILLPLIGKPINGRTLNKKVLGEKFKFTVEYGSMYYIKGEQNHLIGYSNSSENTIAVEKTDYSRGFDYFDTCCGGAARERIEQIKNSNLDEAFKTFSSIAQKFDEMRVLFGDIERQGLGSFRFAPYYSILASIYTPSKNFSDIKLSDFYFIRK